MSNPTLADRFIDVMAEIRAIEPDGDDPMRYVIWRIKEQATQAIANALLEAHVMAELARSVSRDHKEAIAEAAARRTEEKMHE